jgi:sirohydrochlorin cobaltochelatase
MNKAIILFAHGSRDPQWAEPLRFLQARVSALQPQTHVSVAFLELMQPNLQEAVALAVAEGAKFVTIVPAFLAAGGHIKSDLPRLVDAVALAHPQLTFRIFPPLGESEAVLQAIATWIDNSAE